MLCVCLPRPFLVNLFNHLWLKSQHRQVLEARLTGAYRLGCINLIRYGSDLLQRNSWPVLAWNLRVWNWSSRFTDPIKYRLYFVSQSPQKFVEELLVGYKLQEARQLQEGPVVNSIRLKNQLHRWKRSSTVSVAIGRAPLEHSYIR